MRKQFIRSVVHLMFGLLLLAICGTVCACRSDGNQTSSDTGTASTAAEPTATAQDPDTSAESVTDADTETQTEIETEAETYAPYAGSNGKTVNTAAELANGVTGYYTSSTRSAFAIENQNAHLVYNLADDSSPRSVQSLRTLSGAEYLSDTMDSFILLENGQMFYAASSSGRVNVYDQGFYYYDVHVLDQTFGADAGQIAEKAKINLNAFSGTNDISRASQTSEGLQLKIKTNYDPYIVYQGLSYDAEKYPVVLVTLRSYAASYAEVYFVAGSHSNFSSGQQCSFTVINDGEYHTYAVRLASGKDYTGKLTGLRLDIGSEAGEKIDLKEIMLVRYNNDSVSQVTLDRDFIAYSDKINDVCRFMADKTLAGVAAIGTETRIAADTVAKLIVGDGNGTHTDLAEVDWSTAAYVGFDIKDAGTFGYILLSHETSGSLSVELSEGVYIIRQSYTPADGTLEEGSSTYVGHRIYTDTEHAFDTFLYEAYCERNPLTGVRALDNMRNAFYVGYNALRGGYEFRILNGPDFTYAYNNPDKMYSVTLEIDGTDSDRDRKIYILAGSTDGCLECSAVLDKNDRMLPVRVEVCKNFAYDGEELYYTDNDSHAYGYAIFPMVAEAGNTEKVTVLHLFERWGQYRLKQVSSIRFFRAYYHMSSGVTETNCISFYDYSGNRLPDHRAISQQYWGDSGLGTLDGNGNLIRKTGILGNQPQHSNNGSHTFLRYTDGNGKTISTESVRHRIDSSGPVYFDLTMSYVSGDGKMEADIRHMEMAQYDENRAYYQLDYTVTEEISFSDFMNTFEIYALATNNSRMYQYFGYLDENNQSQITDSNHTSKAVVYRLGSECPYFDYFELPDTDPSVLDADDYYSNVSALIKDWDIVIGGKAYTGSLVLVEKNGRVALTLDLGEVTLKPGDYIRMNLILMPWGDRNSTDDSNVRLTRENTLLNPIKTESEKDSVSSDPFLPTVRSADGQTAVFTVSGGLDNIDRTGYASEGNTSYTTYYDRDYNVAVRVEGMRDLGYLGVYELIDGEWMKLELSSDWGFDGYSVLYEDDNSFSYSFNINMNEAKPRTFRVVVE